MAIDLHNLDDLNHGGNFSRFAKATAYVSGRPAAFLLSVTIVVVWACTGPIFKYSDTWQLVINTGTTIITFLMVFLIQNTQNRDSQAVQLKLDEIIRSLEGAHTAMMCLEELTDNELSLISKQYRALAEDGRSRLRQGGVDTGTPTIVAQFAPPRSKKG